MSGDPARRLFANEGMRATGINLSATNARMWNANNYYYYYYYYY